MGITDVQFVINDLDGNLIASGLAALNEDKLLNDGVLHTKLSFDQKIESANVKMWSPDQPNLYYLTVNLLAGNDIIDSEHVRFGFRTIEYRPDEGFLLNGKKVVLNGVCMHHDLGCLGAAINKDTLRLCTLFQGMA